MNDKPENELTDDVVVMSLGIIDNAGWHAEVIMIDQRRQQHRDRDEYMGPHGWLPSPPRKNRHEEGADVRPMVSLRDLSLSLRQKVRDNAEL